MKTIKLILYKIADFFDTIFNKREEDPIFAFIFDYLFKRILAFVIISVGSLFVVHEVKVIISENELAREKKDLAKIEVENYVEKVEALDLSSEDYESLLVFENDLLVYIKNYEEFKQLRPVLKSNDSLNPFQSYFNYGYKLLALKDRIIEEMYPVVIKNNWTDLEQDLNLLVARINSWKKDYSEALKKYQEFLKESDFEKKTKEMIEKYKNKPQGERTIEDVNEISRYTHTAQESLRYANYLHKKFQSDEYYKIEGCFFEIANDYDRRVKTMLKQSD